MNEMVEWLRAVIVGDKAEAEADYEWELVKAKGGYNETITRAEVELTILDGYAEVDANRERWTDAALHLQWTVLGQVVRRLAYGYRNRHGWKGEWAA